MGVSRFIFASSCSVYGSTDKEVNETSDLNPVSLYARTKIDSEREPALAGDTFLPTIPALRHRLWSLAPTAL